jgi:hypothetical protein
MQRVIDPVEILYLYFMDRWQRTAPPDRHGGYLDGDPARNSQTARLVFMLRKIAAGNPERHYGTLAVYSRRERAEGDSYISKDPTWMKEPADLGDGWYFEGCTSLPQKQQKVLHYLGKLGLSPEFCQAAEDFVANKPIDKYLPTEAEEPAVLEKIRKWGEQHKDD